MARTLAICLALIASNTRAFGQSPFDTIEFRDAVRAMVFQYTRRGPSVMVLRYEAEEQRFSDLQVLFEPPAGGSCHVEFWFPPDDHDTFGLQFDRASQHSPPNPDASAVAKQIKMNRAAEDVPCDSQFAKLLAKGWQLRLPLAPDESLSVHGGAYELEMSSPSLRVTVSMNGPQTGGLSDNPVYQWMGQVRLAATARLRSGRPAGAPR